MINYFFGVKYGEDVLRLIANSLSQASVDHNMCYGRLNKDRFAFLIEGSDSDLKEVINA
jgi:GGDEF domain-containing protein